MKAKFLLSCLLFCSSLYVMGQTEIFLGPGFGTNLNKKRIESDLGDYRLMPRNQDYKIDLGIFSGKHFYFNGSFNVYRQEIYLPYSTPFYPSTGEANTTHINNYYTYTSMYKYYGFSAVPGFMLGNKVKFYAGAGVNFDISRIDGYYVHMFQDRYHYDAEGRFVSDGTTSSDTLNQVSQASGSDFSGLVQTGMLFRVFKPLSLQLNLYYRRSFVLRSIDASNDYKSNVGLSVSLMYRIWSSTPREKPLEE